MLKILMGVACGMSLSAALPANAKEPAVCQVVYPAIKEGMSVLSQKISKCKTGEPVVITGAMSAAPQLESQVVTARFCDYHASINIQYEPGISAVHITCLLR